MFIAVDLPEPLGPMMATKSPCSMSRSTPLSAWNAVLPLPYTLVMPRRRINGVPLPVARLVHDAPPVLRWSVITAMPGVSWSPLTSVRRLSLIPVCTGTSTA